MNHHITLPNKLTLLRILLAPFAFATYMLGTHWFPFYWLALLIYIVGLMTDIIDGRLARGSKTTSSFGRSMDSMADKTLVSSVMIAMLGSDRILASLVLLFVCRELLVAGLRAIKMPDHTTIAAINDRWGRIRFFILHAGILVLLFPSSSAAVQWFGTIAVGVSVVMAYGVSIYYLKRDAKALHSSMMSSSAESFAHPKDETHGQPDAIVH